MFRRGHLSARHPASAPACERTDIDTLEDFSPPEEWHTFEYPRMKRPVRL
jgi:hypothetical protein